MKFENVPNSHHADKWDNLASEPTPEANTNKNYVDFGKAAINSTETHDSVSSRESELNAIKDKIKTLEDQLLDTSNALTHEANELWDQLEVNSYQPNMSSSYRELEQSHKAALHEAVDSAFQDLIDEFSSRLSDRELGRLCGKATGRSDFINHSSIFHHFSKEGKLGVMESFGLYDFNEIFKEKGIDIYKEINEQLFDGQLTDQPDMHWEILAASMYDKDQKLVEGICIEQIFREEQYDENGKWTGDQWFTGSGSILINLNDFSDTKLFGRCTKDQREMIEVAKNSNAKNVFDLIDGGADTLVS